MKPLIDPVEWDFRGLPEHQLGDAIFWEYARESEENKQFVIDWLNQGIEGKRYIDWLTLDFNNRLNIVEDRSRLRARIMLEILRDTSATFQERFAHILTFENPAFPEPWQSLKQMPFKGKGSTIFINSTIKLIERVEVQQSVNRSMEFIKEAFGNDYVLNINWLESPSISAIVEDFEKWLREEAKRRKFNPPKGKQAQPPWAYLKELSALRLSKHYSYSKAQAFLKDYQQATRGKHKNAPDVLPIYAEASKWSKAISIAKRVTKNLPLKQVLVTGNTAK